MAAKKISALSDAALPLTGAERLCGVQAGATVGFTVDDLWNAPVVAAGGETPRALAERLGEVVNVKDFGAGSGDVAADTAAILAAWDAGQAAPGAPHLYFPPGTYGFADEVLEIVDDYSLLFGDNAIIRFYGSAVWKWSSTVTRSQCRDLTFAVDSSSTAVAPIWLADAGRTFFQRCHWQDIKTSAIQQNSGVLWLRQCDTDFVAGGGSSVIAATFASGARGAAFIDGGRFNSDDHAAKVLVDHGGAGTFDGCVLLGVNTAGLDGVVRSAPASGGKLSNCVSAGGLYDQVAPAAFKFAPASGASIGDVTIGGGGKINGWGSSTATSGALITIDFTSGATHDADQAISITDMRLAGAQVRAVECLGGTLSSLIVSRNTLNDYGRQVNAASRAIYLTGTFGYLEVADNHGVTSKTHDYDIEFGAVTATTRKIRGNTFAGASPANKARLNKAAQDLVTEREVLLADRTYYVDFTGGSDTNAGLVSSSALKTRQAAWDLVSQLDMNGHVVTIQCADGTYTGSVIAAKTPIGQGSIVFNGNATTPANVLISTTSADAYQFPSSMLASVTIQNQKIVTTISGSGISAPNAAVVLNVSKVEFGAIASQALNAVGPGANINLLDQMTMSGNFSRAAFASSLARVQMTGKTIVINGSLTCGGSFVLATKQGLVQVDGVTFSGSGSITGVRYASNREGVIDTGTDTGSGANATYLPGSIAGTITPGGKYY